VAPVYVDGVKTVTLKGDNIAAEFQKIVEQYVVDTYSGKAAPDKTRSKKDAAHA
jgi:(E)-4-hydroxy-3-methylbut-2-enyl-diphosphate synthase